MTIFEASERYRSEGVPLVVIAGKEYGSGSSRDWAAKGPRLLGVRVVLAETYERIHRSNLIGMGILPLEFPKDQTPETLSLSGEETYDFEGIRSGVESRFACGRDLRVRATRPDGSVVTFEARIRLDTPEEILYYEHGGILPYVLRQLLAEETR
jgi:aconitate hydratase